MCVWKGGGHSTEGASRGWVTGAQSVDLHSCLAAEQPRSATGRRRTCLLLLLQLQPAAPRANTHRQLPLCHLYILHKHNCHCQNCHARSPLPSTCPPPSLKPNCTSLPPTHPGTHAGGSQLTCNEAADHIPHVQEAQDLLIAGQALLLRPVGARRHSTKDGAQAAAASLRERAGGGGQGGRELPGVPAACVLLQLGCCAAEVSSSLLPLMLGPRQC